MKPSESLDNAHHSTTSAAQVKPLELNDPCEVYQRINSELERIVAGLAAPSEDPALAKAQMEAQELLTQQQVALGEELAQLERNAEWNTFTIAFYGETGSGKSTVIETLRILLEETTKLARQKRFREIQDQYGLSEQNLENTQKGIDEAEASIGEAKQELDALENRYEEKRKEAQATIKQLEAAIADYKQKAALWQKLVNLFRKTPEEKELIRAEQELADIETAHKGEIALLQAKQAELIQNKTVLEEKLQALQAGLEQLAEFADGEIIGDGRPDFTRQTQHYDFQLDGQTFALMDVPGIEGNEELIHNEVKKAVQTAHAVFYVTNQAAPPQTGDEERIGTLEKIKAHLGAQTEVWTIFNKKITNPKHALAGRPLVSDDEQAGLDALNEKMREHLGENYRGVIPLSALPAFFATTDHFVPNSQNARRRKRALADFSTAELLDKSRFSRFLQLLGEDLIRNSEAKIISANFRKAGDALERTICTLEQVHGRFSELSETLASESHSAQGQIRACFGALRQRLLSAGDRLIDALASNVRNAMYKCIEGDLSNSAFKHALESAIESQREELANDLPAAIEEELTRFQEEVEDILKRLDEQARELTAMYSKLGRSQLDGDFSLSLNIDNGLQVASILALIAGGALLWWNPGSWPVLAMGIASLVIGAYKAVRSFFSTKYKMAQQRKATDDNLRTVTSKLRESLHDDLDRALNEMEEKIKLIEDALAEPAEKTAALEQLMSRSQAQLKILSLKITNIEQGNGTDTRNLQGPAVSVG